MTTCTKSLTDPLLADTLVNLKLCTGMVLRQNTMGWSDMLMALLCVPSKSVDKYDK